MKIKAYKRFVKSYKQLPDVIKNKVDRQILLMLKDFHHPSLATKKIKGAESIWEVRIQSICE